MTDFDDWRLYAATVGELREELKNLPADMLVILQKDAEGNGYSPLSGVHLGYRYTPDSAHSGDVTTLEDCADQAAEEGLEDCAHDGCWWDTGVDCLVLGPVN